MNDPINPARPQAPSPATKPGQVPPAPIVPQAPVSGAPAGREGMPHSPRREGDNSGGESTASERASADKGHQHAPRPAERPFGE
jgi:hypothetical protein